MSRKTVAKEGVPHPYGHICKGALTSGKDRIPVMLSDGTLIGIATDFVRDDETGEISYEIKLKPTQMRVFVGGDSDEDRYETRDWPSLIDLSMCEATVFVSPYEAWTPAGGTRQITSGSIQGITINLPLGIPKSLIEHIPVAPDYLAVYQSMDRIWLSYLKDEDEAVEWAKKFPLDVVVAVEQ